MPMKSNIKLELQAELTSIFFNPAQSVSHALIRTFATASVICVSACSTYFSSMPDVSQKTEQTSIQVPSVDLTRAKWQKFSTTQPNDNPLRIAIIERETKIGATRVVIKAPPDSTIPPHWFNVQGSFTVLKGTFVFDGVDASGRPERTRRHPGDFATLPASYILRMSTEGADESLLYLTLYGEWSPQLQANPWGKPLLRGAH